MVWHSPSVIDLSFLTETLVGWIATLRELGRIFRIPGFSVVHTIFAIIMCIIWAVLFILTIAAFVKGDIFTSMPEDVIKDSVLTRHESEGGGAVSPV